MFQRKNMDIMLDFGDWFFAFQNKKYFFYVWRLLSEWRFRKINGLTGQGFQIGPFGFGRHREKKKIFKDEIQKSIIKFEEETGSLITDLNIEILTHSSTSIGSAHLVVTGTICCNIAIKTNMDCG